MKKMDSFIEELPVQITSVRNKYRKLYVTLEDEESVQTVTFISGDMQVFCYVEEVNEKDISLSFNEEIRFPVYVLFKRGPLKGIPATVTEIGLLLDPGSKLHPQVKSEANTHYYRVRNKQFKIDTTFMQYYPIESFEEDGIIIVTDEGSVIDWRTLGEEYKEDSGLILTALREKKGIVMFKVIEGEVVSFQGSKRKDGGIFSENSEELKTMISEHVPLTLTKYEVDSDDLAEQLLSPYYGDTQFHTYQSIGSIFESVFKNTKEN